MSRTMEDCCESLFVLHAHDAEQEPVIYEFARAANYDSAFDHLIGIGDNAYCGIGKLVNILELPESVQSIFQEVSGSVDQGFAVSFNVRRLSLGLQHRVITPMRQYHYRCEVNPETGDMALARNALQLQPSESLNTF